MYDAQLFAGWGDMDFNAHMRNTAYLDKSADVRMMFFASQGFPMAEFVRRRLGPIIKKDELEYFREVGLLDSLRVTLAMAALSADGSRFRMRNEFYRADGVLVARVTSLGGWFDLEARKLIAPPEQLLGVVRAMPVTDDFEVVASSIAAG
jgi:acyl-CoA thioester hydrolase